MKNILTAALALAILLALGVPALAVGGENVPAPDFAIKDLKGKALSLADYKGKVLVLNFWATWCGPCRAEIPDFIEAYKENKARGLEILGVSVDRMAPDKLLAFVDKAGINYPVALADRAIVEDYGPGDYIPATIVVDGKGVIRLRHVGRLDKADLVKLFNELIGAK
ncbi:MAG TPA: TlpA disulfide reductase family protein [Acidobacteriota bacterium]|nr:TlpA disulfide reductase family protein [Acidobacteriota bacterium]